jgi:hypothetical protein
MGPVPRIALIGVSLLLATSAQAQSQRYGSSLYFEELPNIAFLLGRIEPQDSFEFRRLLRDHDIQIVVLGSPGGSLYEGLQIASIIHDNRLLTYLPAAFSCESSCANIFFGGVARIASGNLGVHQFYSSEGSQQTTLDSATEFALYTTSDIIGIMNQFDTPPFVYEKMFGTSNIYYFTDEEKLRLGLNANNPTLTTKISPIETFVASNRNLADFGRTSSNSSTTANSSRTSAPTTVPPPNPTSNTFPNLDFFGSDLTSQGYRPVTAAECDNICRSNPNCAAWSYVTTLQWCWPKYAVTNISIADNVTSTIVDYSRIDPEIFERPFIEATGKDIVGYDIFPQGLRNFNLEECRAACERNNACEGFSWVANQNWCFPKYGVSEIRDATGIIAGIWAPK